MKLSRYNVITMLHEIIDEHGYDALSVLSDKLQDEGKETGKQLALFLTWHKFDHEKIDIADLSQFGTGIVKWLKEKAEREEILKMQEESIRNLTSVRNLTMDEIWQRQNESMKRLSGIGALSGFVTSAGIGQLLPGEQLIKGGR